MNLHIKVLAYQLTGHVVWMSVEPATGNLLPKRVPTYPGLDYVNYTGEAAVAQLWQDLIAYTLATSYTKHPISFFNMELSDEHQEDVRLLRAKCFATQFLHNSVNWCLEKNGLYQNPIADVSVSSLAQVYQTSSNLSESDSLKLAQFKKDEYQQQITDLRVAQVAAELAVGEATSVDQVVDIFKQCQTSLGMLRASTDQLTRLL